MRDPSRVRKLAGEPGRIPLERAAQLRLMAQVSGWLAGEGLDAAALTAAG